MKSCLFKYTKVTVTADSNLTKDEQQALKRLKNDKNIVKKVKKRSLVKKVLKYELAAIIL